MLLFLLHVGNKEKKKKVNFCVYNNDLEESEKIPKLQFTHSSCFEVS